MTDQIKYVVVEQTFRGRYVAIRGVSYPTEAEAKQHIVEKFNERFRGRYHVEARKVAIDDDANRMTCQCCGRRILANKGAIAAHGYERPGQGWQTASCWGAGKQPWEVSRNIVGDLIQHLKETLVRSIDQRHAVEAETAEVTLDYVDYNAPKGRRNQSVRFTRETFDAVSAAKPKLFDNYYPKRTFDVLKASDLKGRDRAIAQLKSDIREFQARYDGWVQTHRRDHDAGQWVSV